MSIIEHRHFKLKDPKDLQFIDEEQQGEQTGFVTVTASEKLGKIVEDVSRGVFGKDSLAFSKIEKELQKLEQRRRNTPKKTDKQAIERQECELIRGYLSQRWKVDFSLEALNSLDQKLWTTLAKTINTVCAQNRGYFLQPTKYDVTIGTSEGSVYIVCTLSDYVQKPLGGMGKDKKVSGNLQLVYQEKNNAFVPVGYTSTGEVAHELATLKGDLEDKKRSSEEVTLDLTVAPPPPKQSFFARAGAFFSGCWSFFRRNDRTKPMAQPPLEPVAPAETKAKDVTYKLFSDKKRVVKTSPVISQAHEDKPKPVAKPSFMQSVFACFKRSPAKPVQQRKQSIFNSPVATQRKQSIDKPEEKPTLARRSDSFQVSSS
ncbi:MAG TPA: hypothetical protein VHE99_05740 [Gammaproteobacteria bacterium]|nr:hypothetical protein [Gammaproteobacteria bacterium]